MDKSNIIGKRIKEARKIRKLKQTDLARLLGINPVTLSNYETGSIQPPTLRIKEIAQILGYPASWFLDETGLFVSVDAAIALERAYGIEQPDPEKIIESIENKKTLNLISDFCGYIGQLNDIGKEEAMKRLEELTMIPRYKKSNDQEGGCADGQY